MTLTPITTKFVVDRATWLHRDPDDSYLLRDDGMKCCVGFMAMQCFGLSEVALINVESMEPFDAELHKQLRENAIYLINNERSRRRQTIERELKEAFASIGFEISFEGEVAK